eukprot:CAMPEP_0171353776 /NCGR_PEP_ID=MMETSP0878-20121228/44365_1 /TAXON_ID=67004 /ORGANISM="Thalassiosira weissflogii, Strain CCMP1336" /LENGTH=401 /DNA_ID=CAMNT_0011859731 /DNA_START=55 /DNA_END=1260 /DNA_ORIENTATION=-
MRNIGTDSSTCANVNKNVASGRKTNDVDAITATNVDVSAGTGGEESAVLVNVGGRGDAIVFSNEVESVPSLDEESDDDDDEDSWNSESEDEEEDVDEEFDELFAERLRILADCRALKNLAEAFLHPEQPVKAIPTTFGRNYFDRPSAPAVMDDEDADEEAEILEDVENLKKAARAYLHPEVGVRVEDTTLFGRNYFERPSAPEVETFEEAEERAKILAEAATLKKLAVDYMHPEVGVRKVDGEMFGRNYFNRYSAPETEEDEFADERAEALAEAAALNESMEEAEERAKILAEAAALKQLASDYMHPEVGVKTTDPTLFGRNYFNRYFAPSLDAVENTPESSPEDAESHVLSSFNTLAATVKGANLPSTKNSKLSSLDKNIGTTKKSASTVDLFGLTDEVH